MTKFAVLTSEAKAIVTNFFNAQKKSNIFCEPHKQLMVSLYGIMPDANPTVVDILCQYVVSLSDFMSESDIRLLKSEYSAVIKFCYDNRELADVTRFNEGEQFIPKSLIDLCLDIAEPKAGSSVLVPYAGDGSFAYHLSDCTVDGFEIDEINWAFSQVLLHSEYAVAVSNIELGSSLGSPNKRYDYVFSFPPILHGREGRKVVDLMYDIITKQLQDNGELCCILPMNFCYDGSGWFDVRKILWDYRGQFSMLVVGLPPVLQPLSGINLCLLHVKKNHEDKVVLVDATSEEFLAKRDKAHSKEYVLKVQSVIEAIKSMDEKHVWIGNSSELTGNINLMPSRYLMPQYIQQPKEGERSFKLSDVIEIVPFVKQKGKCPIVGMKNLSSSYMNCDIDRSTLECSSKEEWRILTSDCLLVGFIGGKFKVGRLHGVTFTQPVALRGEVVPVRIKSTEVTEDFLLHSIMSEMTERQARMLATGNVITRLNGCDLLSIVINVPKSKEQQEAICKEDTRSSLTDADRKIIESYESFRKDMHMKKHAIGQTLFNLNNWWTILQQARKEGNGVVSDDATTGKIRKISVTTIYDSLQNTIGQLLQQINKFDRGNGLAVKHFALTEFIEDYIARKQNPLFTFLYDKSRHHASQELPEIDYDEATGRYSETGKILLNEGDPIEYVEFAPEALEIIFDNIVSNACCHGFKNSADRKNILKIELTTEGDNYVVVVSNNGFPIHKQINPEDVFIYGKTSKMGSASTGSESHFGIGGYEVQKLMREFGGDAKFVSEPDSEFPVSYKLTFYNTNLESVEL